MSGEDEWIYGEEWWSGFSSSNVAAIKYSLGDRRLYVRFHSGSGSYFNVDEGTARAFYHASSKGKYVHAKLKNVYPWVRA